MPQLTIAGKVRVKSFAQKYAMSEDAVIALLDALVAGRGMGAQFNHPDLGGMGQWTQGGMIMIGDMFNNELKHRVGSLCSELSGMLNDGQMVESQPARPTSATAHSAAKSSHESSYSTMSPNASGWWPSQLGNPSSQGSQNDLHYAYFAAAHRLALLDRNHLTIFDTGEHQIHGFSQHQSAGQSLSFQSQLGLVKVSDLKVVQV